MNDLLKKFILEALTEMRNDARVPTQLIPKKTINGRRSEDKGKEKESEQEVDEMSGVGAIAGFTGPLGASAADMGKDPVKPGGRLKKRKKAFVRWK